MKPTECSAHIRWTVTQARSWLRSLPTQYPPGSPQEILRTMQPLLPTPRMTSLKPAPPPSTPSGTPKSTEAASGKMSEDYKPEMLGRLEASRGQNIS
ncbi:TPA: hypothetical protein ACH3X3_008238 [Trebouxia sp. C0006]